MSIFIISPSFSGTWLNLDSTLEPTPTGEHKIVWEKDSVNNVLKFTPDGTYRPRGYFQFDRKVADGCSSQQTQPEASLSTTCSKHHTGGLPELFNFCNKGNAIGLLLDYPFQSTKPEAAHKIPNCIILALSEHVWHAFYHILFTAIAKKKRSIRNNLSSLPLSINLQLRSPLFSCVDLQPSSFSLARADIDMRCSLPGNE